MRTDQGTRVWAFEAPKKIIGHLGESGISISPKMSVHIARFKILNGLYNGPIWEKKRKKAKIAAMFRFPCPFSEPEHKQHSPHGSPNAYLQWLTKSLLGNWLLIAWWLKISITVPTHFLLLALIDMQYADRTESVRQPWQG